MDKVFIDKELWYIENFLTEKEMAEIMTYANEPTGWYKTLRSVSIRNKFIINDIPLHPEGTLCPHRGIDIGGDIVSIPTPEITYPINVAKSEMFSKPDGIGSRLGQVLPDHIVGLGALQSFWPLSDGDTGGGAFEWHHEKGHKGVNDNHMTAAWTLYINDDFEGGVLEFLNKPYTLKPKRGMLVSIPMTKEWTHRVTPITKGIRHTLYGTCFSDPNDRHVSTMENC